VNSFWQTINKPIFALAPMEGVTDTVFREIALSVSNPDILSVIFTEFTSTDGLCHDKGRKKVMERLIVSQSENRHLKENCSKLVAQIWGSEPEKFYKSARIISELEAFDGIDINMGCPVKKVVHHKSCSALINDPILACEIIQASKEGSILPVSVKTRLGYKTVNTEEWIGTLLETKPQAITLHGRTQKMMSYGQVLWEEISKALQLRNTMKSNTVIIGNGDILDYSDAISKIEEYSLDGIMIGRGIFKDPWIFNALKIPVSIEDKVGLLEKHIQLFSEIWKNKKNYNILKRFYKIYLNDFYGASEWREYLMNTSGTEEALIIIQKFKTELNKHVEINKERISAMPPVTHCL
jgi:tRNA-dihydrouridine synthase